MTLLSQVTDGALNDRRRAAERIADEAWSLVGAPDFRPSLLQLDSERRRRRGLPPVFLDRSAEVLLPPGGEAELRDMVRRYRRRARKRGRR